MKKTDKILMLLVFRVLNVAALYYISTFFNIWYGLLTIGVITFCGIKTVRSRKRLNSNQQKYKTSSKPVSQNNSKRRYREHDSYVKRGVNNGNKK